MYCKTESLIVSLWTYDSEKLSELYCESSTSAISICSWGEPDSGVVAVEVDAVAETVAVTVTVAVVRAVTVAVVVAAAVAKVVAVAVVAAGALG